IATVDAKGVETPAEALVDMGTVAAGDWSDTRFRLRNTGAASVALSALRVSGAGFTILGNPPLPHQMLPGANVDFRIRFGPTAFGSFSAALLFNDKTLLVRGVSPQGVTLLVERDGKLQAVATTAPIVLGRVERGSSLTQRFHLRNETPSALTVNRITMTGAGFSGPSEIVTPVLVDAGRSIPFEIGFAPSRNGILQGTLTLEDRLFLLEGVGFDPPFPDAIITVEPAVPSGTQAKVSLRLAALSRVPGLATLRLEFRTAVPTALDDPAVVFLPSGSRTIPVNIREGDTNMGEFQFQTGTTAGEIRFRIEMPGQVGVAQTTATTVSRAMVSMDTTRITRGSNSLQVEIIGFDNTRTASRLTFRFFDRAGSPLAGDPILAEVAEAFQRHFRDTSVGGVFLLRASFPVTGDSSQLSAVEVEMENSAGASRSRTSF
ncbi:MAG: choice-of-anchor D domain-containing protein, partial [Acidobacteriia bacterium]|nr:choice-of-anchor D domain-containing protein [Terriglobia bacterium]